MMSAVCAAAAVTDDDADAKVHGWKTRVVVIARRDFGKGLFFLDTRVLEVSGSAAQDLSVPLEAMFKSEAWGGPVPAPRFAELRRDLRVGDVIVISARKSEPGGARDKVSSLLHAHDAAMERMRLSDNTGRVLYIGAQHTVQPPAPGDKPLTFVRSGKKEQRRQNGQKPGPDAHSRVVKEASALDAGSELETLAARLERLKLRKQIDYAKYKQLSLQKQEKFNKLPVEERRDAVLRSGCPERAQVFGAWIMDQYLQIKGDILDVAGGKGELALVLTLGGASSVVVDPRVSTLKQCQRKQMRRRGRNTFRYERVEFGTDHSDSVEATPRLCAAAGLIVGLHPDQAAGSIVETAVARALPFAVVPCCVFARLFPDRKVDGEPVTSHAQLCLWLLARHPAIRATRLGFPGQVLSNRILKRGVFCLHDHQHISLN